METEDTDLETGWGPATPAGDNLANDYAQGLAEGYAGLARAGGEAVAVDDVLALTDGGSPSPFGNIAVVRRPVDPDEWPDTVDRMRAFYGERPGGDYLVFSPCPTPDLTTMGFGRIGHPPLMLRPPGPLDAAPPAGLTIREVVGGEGADDWERVFVDGFPLPELQPWVAGCLLSPPAFNAPGWRHWVGYLDGEPVGTASAVVSATHVDVEFVATLDAARGRGVGRALTATATLADPSLPALLIASDPGRPVYERLGYRALTRYTLWAGHR